MILLVIRFALDPRSTIMHLIVYWPSSVKKGEVILLFLKVKLSVVIGW
jgi:hypothetical protein